MIHLGKSIAIASATGVAAVYLLPPEWLPPLAAAVAIGGLLLSLVVRFNTPTKPPSDAVPEFCCPLPTFPSNHWPRFPRAGH